MQRHPRVSTGTLRSALLITAALTLGVSAHAVSAQDATTVSPLTSSPTAVPQVGTPVAMLTVDEIHKMGNDALSERNDFEDARAELYSCYQRAYSTKPNAVRMIGYDEGVEASRKLSATTA